MPLTKTTTRALAASVAMVVAGGTVAGAAVFHVPILGFSAASAGAGRLERTAASASSNARAAAPVRIVKTRIVDDIVHRPSAASTATRRSAGAPPATFAPGAAAAPSSAPPPADRAPLTSPPGTPPVTTSPTTTPPTTTPPVAEPPDGPDHGHGDDHDGDDGSGDDSGTPGGQTGTTQGGQ